MERASTVVVSDSDRRILVIERDFRRVRFPGRLDLIGCLALPGECPAAAALREIRQEAGLQLDRLRGCENLPRYRGEGIARRV